MSSKPSYVMVISDGEESDDGDFAILPAASSSRQPLNRPAAPIYIDDSDSSTASDGEETPALLDILIGGSSKALHSARTPVPPLDVPIVSGLNGKGKERQIEADLDLLDSYHVGIEDLDELPRCPAPPSRIAASLLTLADNLESPPPKPQKKKKRKSDTVDDVTNRESADTARSGSVAAGPSKDTSRPKPSKEERDAIKAQEKKDKELAKAAAKAAKEAERSFQKKLTDANRLRTSKRETVREIHLYLSHDLSSPLAPIAAALPEIRFRLEDNSSALHFLDEMECPIPNVIRFKRHLTSTYDHAAKRFIPLAQPRWEWEKTVLVIATADDIVDRILAAQNNEGETLQQWVGDLRLALGIGEEEQMFLMIKELGKYYAKSKTLANREFAAAARAGLSGTQAGNTSGRTMLSQRPTKEQIELELVKLQLTKRCFLVHVEKTEDIEDWTFNLACDIAIRPYKLISKSHLNFCPPDGLKKSAESTGVLELMLQEIQGITPSAAVGIASEYPTFRDLMEAYEKAERKSREEAEGMLKDCEIKNLRNGTANGRKLKQRKALSKRVFNVMRGTDSLALV